MSCFGWSSISPGGFFDAQATVHLAGGLVALVDLVLHEASMDVRRPTPELTRAAIVLSTRRIADEMRNSFIEHGLVNVEQTSLLIRMNYDSFDILGADCRWGGTARQIRGVARPGAPG